ncbi:MFS transporter [Schleiferilactobacillus harbinensis]|uniref:MFS transporter n=1 Tax=Schleiferilactobacillus harbinensis TaxID=304207 RepID=UPI0039ED4D80
MNVFLHNKSYRTLVLSSSLSQIGSVLFNIVFIIYAGSLPYKTLAVSLVMIANFVPNFFQIPTGYLADQTTKRIGKLIGQRLLQFGLYLLLAVLIGWSQSIWIFAVLLLINIASDIIAGYSSSLILPYFKHFVKTEQLSAATGFETGLGNVISIVFQGLGASLIVALHQNYAWFGIINAVSFLLAGLVLLAQRRLYASADAQDTAVHAERAAAAPTAHEGFFRSVLHSAKILYADKPLFAVIMLVLLVNMLFTSVDGLTNVLLTTQKNLWLGSYGNTVAILGMTGSLAMAAGAIFSHDGLQKLSVSTLISLSVVGTVVYAVNMFTLANPYLMVGMMVGEGYLVGKVNPRLSAQVISTLDQDRLAASMSIISTLSLIGAPLSQGVFLTLANVVSPTLTWQIYTAFAVAGVVAGVLTTRYLHRLTDNTPSPIADK